MHKSCVVNVRCDLKHGMYVFIFIFFFFFFFLFRLHIITCSSSHLKELKVNRFIGVMVIDS